MEIKDQVTAEEPTYTSNDPDIEIVTFERCHTRSITRMKRLAAALAEALQKQEEARDKREAA